MEKNFSNQVLSVKFKIVKEDENPSLRIVNTLFISGHCILAITGVYYFISTHSFQKVIFFVSLFFLLMILMEIVNEILNTEYMEFKIMNNTFIIIRGNKVVKFDINKCKINYHEDKTDWLELNCEDNNFNFSLSQRRTKDLQNFINKNFSKNLGLS